MDKGRALLNYRVWVGFFLLYGVQCLQNAGTSEGFGFKEAFPLLQATLLIMVCETATHLKTTF